MSVAIIPSAFAEPCGVATQFAGVDNKRMGAYRALTQLSFQAYQRGDVPAAAELARILERAFARGEEHGGDKSLGKTDPKLFEQLDDAMDPFVNSLMNYVCGHSKAPPKSAALEAAYKQILELLDTADRES
jgi:hypothetical protein